MDITLFHHNLLLYNWYDIVDEQIFLIKKYGLYDECSNITIIDINNDQSDKFRELINKNDNLKKWHLLITNENKCEYDCLNLIKNFSKINKSYICYFHTKGAGSVGLKQNIGLQTWRQLLNHFILTKWEECIKLLKNNDVVGVTKYSYQGHDNFSGNFWWAKTEYLNTLNDVSYTDNRYIYENWILSNPLNKSSDIFNIYNIGYEPNPYLVNIPILKYRNDYNNIIDELIWKIKRIDNNQEEKYWYDILSYILNSNIDKKNILEIGCDNLYGTVAFCDIFDNVYSIDIEKKENWDEFSDYHSNWKYFIGTFDNLYNVIKNLDIKFNFIFINNEINNNLYDDLLYNNGIILNKKYYKKMINDEYITKLLSNKRMFFQGYENINELYGLKDLIDENITDQTIICEIGSFAGVSSELFSIYCKKIYCIDKWDAYYDVNSMEIMMEAENKFDKLINKYDNIIKLKMSSLEAVKLFPDEFFDIIYIDASHLYNDVKTDIINWLPKIKKNGIISGHDYWTPSPTDTRKMVKDAINDLFGNLNIKIYKDSSWLIKLDDYYNYNNWTHLPDFHSSYLDIYLEDDKIYITPYKDLNNIEISIKNINDDIIYNNKTSMNTGILYWIMPNNKSYIESFKLDIIKDEKIIISKKIT